MPIDIVAAALPGLLQLDADDHEDNGAASNQHVEEPTAVATDMSVDGEFNAVMTSSTSS